MFNAMWEVVGNRGGGGKEIIHITFWFHCGFEMFDFVLAFFYIITCG